jgi:hypothetical protein
VGEQKSQAAMDKGNKLNTPDKAGDSADCGPKAGLQFVGLD